MPLLDSIVITDLLLHAHIGVPDGERASAQRLTTTITLQPTRDFANLADRIESTVDYFAVAERVKALAAERPRHLIETLATDIADTLLAEWPLRAVEVEIKKYILPDAAHVAVRIHRTAR